MAGDSITRADSDEVMLAVNSLKGRFEGAYGRSPNLLGGSQQGAAPQGYASRQEMTPNNVRWDTMKKSDAYGLPALCLILGIVYLFIGWRFGN